MDALSHVPYNKKYNDNSTVNMQQSTPSGSATAHLHPTPDSIFMLMTAKCV